ncbi:MAG: hypothetical protein U0359_41780 [Byssovorax sp.]
MARTPRTDRASVADAPLTVRFTRAERAALNQAVKLREKELGLGATVTQATLIRGLVRRYCEERGIPIEEEPMAPELEEDAPAARSPRTKSAAAFSGAGTKPTRKRSART